MTTHLESLRVLVALPTRRASRRIQNIFSVPDRNAPPAINGTNQCSDPLNKKQRGENKHSEVDFCSFSEVISWSLTLQHFITVWDGEQWVTGGRVRASETFSAG